MSISKPQVGVVYDWENTVLTSRDILPYGAEVRQFSLDPVRLANNIVSRIANEYAGAQLAEVFIATGIHCKHRNASLHERRSREIARWRHNRIVTVEARQLHYFGNRCAESPEIDEFVWSAAITAYKQGNLDHLVVFSNDRAIGRQIRHSSSEYSPTKVHAAVWGNKSSTHYRHGTFVHHMSEADFARSSAHITAVA